MKKAIFWDNDGILVDTEKYYYEANYEILKKHGVELTKELYIDLFLIQAKGAWHLLDHDRYSQEDIEQLRRERNALYLQFLLTKEIVVEGVEDILAALSEKYRMAIVTSSQTEHFYAIHARTGFLKYFDFVISGDDYVHCKPHPEPYLTAVKKMGVGLQESIAIEDSRRGLIAAKAAGLECIVVPSELTKTSDFSEADYVLPKLQDITLIL